MNVTPNFQILYEFQSARVSALEHILRNVALYIEKHGSGDDDRLVVRLIRDAVGEAS